METPDKNAHLSPVLSRIKDYGPGDSASGKGPESSEPVSNPEPSPAGDQAPRQEPEAASRPGRAGGPRWAVYGLVVLWLLTLVGGFLAFVWQQTRVDELIGQRDAERRAALDSITAAETDSERLAETVTALEREMAELRSSLADAQRLSAPSGTEAAQQGEAPLPARPPASISLEQPSEQPSMEIDDQPAALATMPDEAALPAAGVAETDAGGTARRPEFPAGSDRETGGWFVNLSTFSSRALASEWLAQRSGLPGNISIHPVESGGKTLFRVRIGGFQSRDEARRAADRIVADWNLESAWISAG
jgi:cell division septation protein DedD